MVEASAHPLLGYLCADRGQEAIGELTVPSGAQGAAGRGADVLVVGWASEAAARAIGGRTPSRSGAGPTVLVVGSESSVCHPPIRATVSDGVEFVTLPSKGGRLGPLVRGSWKAARTGRKSHRVKRALILCERGAEVGAVLRALLNGPDPLAPVWVDSVRAASTWMAQARFDCVIASERVGDGSTDPVRAAAAVDGIGFVRLIQEGSEGVDQPREIALRAHDLHCPESVRRTVQSAIERAASRGERACRDERRLISLLMCEQEKLIAAARSDPLTGVPNRAAFEDVLEHQLRTGTAPGETALILIDIDHFKRINDRHGHHVGDAVLRSVSQAIAQAAAGDGTTFRVGGEEFAVVVEGRGAMRAAEVGEAIRATVEHAQHAPGIRVTVSVGITQVDWTLGISSERAFALADAALYRAKRGGRNRVEIAA